MRHALRAVLVTLSIAAAQTCVAESPAETGRYAVIGSFHLPVSTHGVPLPSWTGGALVYVFDEESAAPLFRGFDRSGQEVLHYSFTIPKAPLIHVFSGGYARGDDGSLAVTGLAYSDDSQATYFLAWVSPDGERQTVVRMESFFPKAAVIAADGNIWLAGFEPRHSPSELYDAESHILRRFDNNGKLLGSFVSLSSLAGMLEGAPGAVRFHPARESRLVASRDRVGWFSPIAGSYMEFSLNGDLIGEYRLPEVVSKRNRRRDRALPALCDEGGVYLGSISYGKASGPKSWGLFSLNRSSGTWDFSQQSGTAGVLYGCDGDALVTKTRLSTIEWLRSSSKR